MSLQSLAAYLEASAARYPDRVAVVDPDGRTITYAELNRHAEALAGFLSANGVSRGDRVGVVLPKSIAAVTSLFGVMKAGAAYVPIDCTAPAERSRRILSDCGVRAAIVHARCAAAIPGDDHGGPGPVLVMVKDAASPRPAGLEHATAFETAVAGTGPPPDVPGCADDLAYILYTSGSTGMPKGVMLTHANALSFVEWSSAVFAPDAEDRFGSHAPFHFDLSVLDIYLSVKHGAALHLISEDLGRSPKDLAAFIAERQLTIWYSTPSILTLLVQFGQLEKYAFPALRIVLFAGEVFPIKHLRQIQARWPAPAYLNLYGPTETNVCTFARIPSAIPANRETPYPIGEPCDHCRALVLDAQGEEVAPGGEGLLYISGPSVFQGYWNRPAESTAAFVERQGARWYNTGDLVRGTPDGGFVYLGRNDRMVKRRGYRVELGEIERALYAHPRLREAAVVAVSDEDAGIHIAAFVSCGGNERPSLVELKTFCGARLPAYMSPDRFVFLDRLPRTSTDKVDYQTLNGLAAASRSAHASV